MCQCATAICASRAVAMARIHSWSQIRVDCPSQVTGRRHQYPCQSCCRTEIIAEMRRSTHTHTHTHTTAKGLHRYPFRPRTVKQSRCLCAGGLLRSSRASLQQPVMQIQRHSLLPGAFLADRRAAVQRLDPTSPCCLHGVSTLAILAGTLFS